MREFKWLVFVWLILLVVPFISFGQTAPSIKVTGRAFPDSVMLRWAPDAPLAWSFLNEHGYLIERFTIVRNGKVLDQPESQVLTVQPIKPLPLAQWESLINKNGKYAAVAAQAIYGNSFELTDDNSEGSYFSIYQQSKEEELRYSFALFSADMSPLVAKSSGLWFVDKGIKENEEYLYKVKSAVPKEVYNISEGTLYIGAKDYYELPKPQNVKAEFVDKQVMLKWEIRLLESFYNAYWVERSDDGGESFFKITEEPVIVTYPENGDLPNWMYKIDSLSANNKKYFYRVQGISPFGELSPYSDPVGGKGTGIISNSPQVLKKENINNEHVFVTWNYPYADSLNLTAYEVQRGTSADGTYKTLVNNLNSTQKSFLDKFPGLNNYYKIVAYDAAGNAKASMPVLVQLVDSLPPAVPQGLYGEVDTAGRVQLYWHANKDSDVMGYRVYRANSDSEEFSQITREPVQSNFYVDTVSLKTLSSKVYYKIMAIDLRQNHSSFSKPFELKRPSMIPPVAPLFKAVKSTTEGVELEWYNSSSEGIIKHLLYRTQKGNNQWALIAVFADSDTTSYYDDKNLEDNKEYQYTLIALNESNLESKPAKPVSGKKITKAVKPAINKIYAKYDSEAKVVNLAWYYPEEGVEKYIIYRSEDDAPLSLLGVTNEQKYADVAVKLSRKYNYGIQAVFKDGSTSVVKKINIGF